jgi:hypothetical protein
VIVPIVGRKSFPSPMTVEDVEVFTRMSLWQDTLLHHYIGSDTWDAEHMFASSDQHEDWRRERAARERQDCR